MAKLFYVVNSKKGPNGNPVLLVVIVDNLSFKLKWGGVVKVEI